MADSLTPANCVGRVIPVGPSCGCTLTRTNIKGLTPDDIVAFDTKEMFLGRAILDAKEAKMLGVPERGLFELMNSRIKDVKDEVGTVKVEKQSIIMPLIQRTQRNVINANYFTIETGSVPSDAGTTGVPLSSWDVVVNLGPSWLKSPISAIERYFVPGSTLIVLTWDNVANKNAQTLVFTILRAVNADVGNTAKAKVTLYPNYNSTGYAALSNSEKNALRPTFGVAQTGANSISDWESYCPSQPADLSRRIIVNFLQTTRESYCRQQSYEEVLDLILKGKVNDYLAGFKYQSIADQQKQQAARNRREWMNSVFYGQALDVVNQTVQNWANLPIVYDAYNTTCPQAYKASAEGIFTLLQKCNRVIDMAGQKLSMDYIFNQLYYLRRNREAEGDSVQVIDSLTDRYTANTILEVMSKYYNVRYGMNTTRYYNANQKIEHDGLILFNYNIYDIPDASVQWAVFVDDFFNDQIDAFGSTVVGWDFRTRARSLWFIDWSDIDIGMVGQSQVTRKHPDPDVISAYKCVIKTDMTTYDFRSKTWTVLLDRPQRHLIIYNFSDACPQITAGKGCVVPQS